MKKHSIQVVKGHDIRYANTVYYKYPVLVYLRKECWHGRSAWRTFIYGSCLCNNSSRRDSGNFRMMLRVIDAILFSLSFVVCLLNKVFCFSSNSLSIERFFRGYFNDLVGSFGFAALCNFLLVFSKRTLRRYFDVVLLMLFCGIVWEVITPLFRQDTVGDIRDMVVYLIGGSLYYFLILAIKRYKKTKDKRR